MRGWALAAFVAAAGACTPLHRVDLVPAAVGHDAIEARVIAWASDNSREYYQAFELELRNPGTAPADVDLAAARLTITSLLAQPAFVLAPYEGGLGALPQLEPHVVPPVPHVTLAPGETRTVWIAFGQAAPPPALVVRATTLGVPGAGDITVDELSAEHPHGLRSYRSRHRAFGVLVRIDVEQAHDRNTISGPYEVGATANLGDFRVDAHLDSPLVDDSRAGRVSLAALRAGLGVDWWPVGPLGVYTTIDYQSLSTQDVVPANGLVLGVGASLPLYRPMLAPGWRVTVASLRVGWAGTLVSGGDSFSALRIGIEVAPTWRW